MENWDKILKILNKTHKELYSWKSKQFLEFYKNIPALYTDIFQDSKKIPGFRV